MSESMSEGAPQAQQQALATVVDILDGILERPQDPTRRRIVAGGGRLAAAGMKLLASCGFVEQGPGEYILPPTADLAGVHEAREDVARLLVGSAARAAQGTVQGSARSTGQSEAAALQLAAANVSRGVPGPGPSSTLGRGDDVLGGIAPSPSEAPAAPGEKSLKVPASVLAAAAQVSSSHGLQVPGYAPPPRRGGREGAGGACVWTAGPPGVSADSRLAVDLPELEFTYIERPWSHFVTRWAAIDVELERQFGENPFSCVDLGSCNGFISLQLAAGYPEALAVGIEGSVGVGNGTVGVQGSDSEIVETKAVQTHLRWMGRLNLTNSFIAPEVWDYRRVCGLSALGRPIADVLLSLSVIHHMDNVSPEQYATAGLGPVEGCIDLIGKLLTIANAHFIELPDRPWMEAVHDAYPSARAILEAAAQRSGMSWAFAGPLCVAEWYGTRELWLLERADGPVQGVTREAMPRAGLKALFPRTLGVQQAAVQPARQIAAARAALPPQQRQPALALRRQPGLMLTQEQLGAVMLAAPMALLAAHVQLRDAMAAGEDALQDMALSR